jgi:hypothetical protein
MSPRACGALCALLLLGAPASASGLAFGESPALPVLPTVTLNGGAQTIKATMTNFSVTETAGESGGWNVTFQGSAGSGKSAVFAQYCPNTTCGADAKGYVGGGQTLAANSLTLSSTGASFTGGTGTTPELKCTASACNVDSATAVKVASRATGVSSGGTWKTTGFSASSLALKVKSTLRALKSGEIYRVDILWTLATGP